ncbi:flagellar hook-associated protein FlgK [Gracilimonas sp. Q87]|uniref:flagellar hook-associated protein FlgK n=1 Tax=Gracilimonas sp. Q87 TaxID=3384766 RepID=UPI0039843C34
MRSLLEISKSGLKSAERSLSVTSNNIINANTPGYTRQRLEKSPNGMQMSGSHIGLGVEITGLTRMRNQMNDVLMNQKQQDMSFMQGQARVFEQLEAVVATDSGNDLDLSISKFLDSFSELSSNPQDMSLRNSLISNAQELTGKFQDIDRNIERISELSRDSGMKSVEKLNSILSEIHSLNKAIEQGEAAGKSDNASLDMRVARMEDLSNLIDFDSQVTETGAVEIRVSGVTILDSDKAHTVTTEIDDIRKEFTLRIESGKTIDVTGGRLGAEVEMYSKQISEMNSKLDLLASTLVEKVNEIHRNGYGLNDDTSRNFFDPAGTTASEIQLNSAMKMDPRNIAASSVDAEAGNGIIAADIAELRNELVVGGRKMIDFSIELISTPGTKLQNLNSQIEARDSELNMLKTQQEREAGVNIDEELSLMIQYQNAYQGAAKVMSAAQNMYDTLIGIVR